MLRTVLVATILSCCGCTSLHITDATGNLRVERHAGFLQLILPGDVSAIAADIRSVGFYTTPLGTSLGVSTATFVTMSPDCRLIVFGGAAHAPPRLPGGTAPDSICLLDTKPRRSP